MALDEEKHVMLSYQWDNKALVSKVYKILIENGIKAWMDVNGGIGDNVNISMAEGVENAHIVCCFMTPAYQKSYNCRRELEYANELAKKNELRIIPCINGDQNDMKWRPSSWLGLITSALNYVNFRDGSDSNIQLKTKELINRIKNQSFIITTESVPLPDKLFETIRQKYLRENRIKRIVNEEKSFSIEQSYINLAMVESKEQHEKEKKLKQYGQENMLERGNEEDNHAKQHKNGIMGTFEEIYGIKTSIDTKDIFQKCKNQTNKVLVLGRAGIGKSTFCQYVTYRWAKGEIWNEYDLVVLIRLRKLRDSRYSSEQKYSPIDLLKKEYLPFDDLSSKEKQRFKEQCNASRVLWILDGYDEFVQDIPEQLKEAFNYVLETQHHILTSRPYAITLSYDVKMEIIGFTDDNIAKYIEQFFDQIKDEIPNASIQGQKLLNFSKSNSSIWGIAHIPVNLELICSLWSDTDWSKNTTLTMTTLYDNITQWLCRRHLKNKNINPEQKRKQWVYNQCEKELIFLETLAFNAMENNQIILPPTLLENTEHETKCFLDDHPQLLNFGILKSYDDKPTGNQTQAEKQHYFIHLSFQEHFAARHLLRTLQSSDKHRAIDFIRNHKYNQRFQLVFIFASGLLAQSDYKSNMDAFWKTIQEEPLDLVGLKHIKLIILCIDELGDQTVFPERAHYLKSICQWLDICVRQAPSQIIKNLVQSIRHTNSLSNKPIIQNKLTALIETPNTVIKRNAIYVTTQLTISDPTPKLLSTILAALQDEDLDVQNGAVEALGTIGEKAATTEVIASLFNALRDQGFLCIRSKVSEALAKMGEKGATNEVIASLLNAFQDEDLYIRSGATEAFMKMGEKAATTEVITALMNALRHQDPHVRYIASRTLGKMGEKAATNEVIVGLSNALRDEDRDVRYGTTEVLMEMGEKAATSDVIAGLLNLLRDQYLYIRSKAIEALVKISEKRVTCEVIPGLLNALRDQDPYVRYGAAETLGNMEGKAATSEVITDLSNALRDQNPNVRWRASEALGKISEKTATNEVIAGLLNALRDQNSDVRWKGIEALGKIGEKTARSEVIGSLLNALQDEHPYVRYAASVAFGNMGKKAATKEVIAGLLNALRDQDSAVREQANEALEKMGEKATTSMVIPGLLNDLRDQDPYVRYGAAETLGNMGGKAATSEVIADLSNALRDQDSNVRWKASEALVEMGEKAATSEVIPALLNALRHQDSDVRGQASKALGKMGEKAATDEVITGLLFTLRDENFGVRYRASEALGNMSEKAATNEVIAGLLNALRDQDSVVRDQASVALGNMGEKAATNEVIAGLLNGLRDQYTNVRYRTSEALVKIGKKAATNEVITGLLNALQDEDAGVRYPAGDALGKIGSEVETTDVITGLLNVFAGEMACKMYDEATVAFEGAMASYRALKELDLHMILKLYSCIKRCRNITLEQIAADQFINVFLETKNVTWLAIIRYAALIQDIGITVVGNKVKIHDVKGVLKLDLPSSELVKTLVNGLRIDEKELENDRISKLEDRNKLTQ